MTEVCMFDSSVNEMRDCVGYCDNFSKKITLLCVSKIKVSYIISKGFLRVFPMMCISTVYLVAVFQHNTALGLIEEMSHSGEKTLSATIE